jgi:hypothetical protein
MGTGSHGHGLLLLLLAMQAQLPLARLLANPHTRPCTLDLAPTRESCAQPELQPEQQPEQLEPRQ